MQDGDASAFEDASAFRTAVITLQGVSESPGGVSQQPAACVPRVSDSVSLGVAPESGCLTSSPDAHAAVLRTTLGELLLWKNVSQIVATNQDHLGMKWEPPGTFHFSITMAHHRNQPWEGPPSRRSWAH